VIELLAASGTIELPSWAVSAFVALFFLVIAVAGWGLRYLGRRIHDDLEGLSAELKEMNSKLAGYNERLIRLETYVYDNRSGPFPRAGTPVGVTG